jgi:hypothetical protein
MALAIAPFALHAQQTFKGGHQEVLGSAYGATPFSGNAAAQLMHARPRPTGTTERVAYWSTISVDATGVDHTPVAPGEVRNFGEQVGPGRASRAVSIVHIAMFDALLATRGGRYRSYTGIAPDRGNASPDAAIAQAAHDTLVALFPSQAETFGSLLEADLNAIRVNQRAKAAGVAVGQRAAAAILRLRSRDGSQHTEPRVGENHHVNNAPGRWRPDPVSRGPLALGVHWGSVKPFGIDRVSRFRPPPPPSMGSREYARAFEEVVALGGDGVQMPTRRTHDQTFAGIFWAYDGTPSLCAPPRLFNQIALHIAAEQRTRDPLELMRLLTLVNIAMADATIVAWEAKYRYDFWRPVTAVREASPGSGPSRLGDGNPHTHGIPNFMPLGAPASNLHGPNFTPPFPAYPSGHAIMGGATFEVLRQFYGTDHIAFTFTSDELNGVTLDNTDTPRLFAPRTYNSLSEAEMENAISRVYLGVHFRFDVEAGVRAGRKVARHVFDNVLTRSRKDH